MVSWLLFLVLLLLLRGGRRRQAQLGRSSSRSSSSGSDSTICRRPSAVAPWSWGQRHSGNPPGLVGESMAGVLVQQQACTVCAHARAPGWLRDCGWLQAGCRQDLDA